MLVFVITYLTDTDVKVSLYFGLIRVKNQDDSVSEMSDTPELTKDPNETRHPSLTVAFTFKVSLSFVFLIF